MKLLKIFSVVIDVTNQFLIKLFCMYHILDKNGNIMETQRQLTEFKESLQLTYG
jgi:hypothetical protein